MRRRRSSLVAAVAALTLLFLLPGVGTADTLDTWIVTFETPPTPSQLESLSGIAAGVHGYEHVPAAAVTVTALDLGILANLPGVRGVYPNTSMVPMLRQSTRSIRADHAWATGWTGAGVGVAVIDTGIDGTHPDLCAAPTFCEGTAVKTVQNVKFLGRETVADPVVVLEDQINTDTSSGHGTHVAGIAAGLGVASDVGDDYRGVAPGADLIGLGTGEAIEAVNVLAAFDWVVDNAEEYNIRVVNNSWGPGAGTPHDPSHPVNLAIRAAYEAGVTVVFGAGNAGPTTDTMNAFSIDPYAFSVAGGMKDGHIAFFSSRGVPGSDLWRPDVTAPGYMISAPRASTGFYADIGGALSPNPDPVAAEDEDRYVTNSGTSMASPHVAGIVALMQQAAFESRGVWLTPDEVRNIIQHTAVSDDPARGPSGAPNYQAYTMGAGYADASAAVQAAAAGTHTEPWDDGVATQVAAFSGQVGPAALINTQTFDTTIEVPSGAVSLNVMIEWGAAANDVDLDLFRPDGSLARSTFLLCNPDGEPNGYSSFCTQIANERLTVAAPQPGMWRAVVKGGLAQTVETVTGLWSVDHPDGTVLPPPAAPAAISIAADPATAAVTGTDVTLTATVTDASGEPVPGAPVTFTSSGVGTIVTAEPETHARGWAMATVSSQLPGTQSVTIASGDVTATVDLTWIGLDLYLDGAALTPGRASGGGWFDLDGTVARFGFHAGYADDADGPAGELSFQHGDTNVRFDAVRSFVVDGTTATVEGPASVNGDAGYRYRLEVTDHGEPGRGVDTFDLTVTHPVNLLYRYEAAGTLAGGNLQVVTP